MSALIPAYPEEPTTDRELFLSWFNDFITVSAFAEYYGMTKERALQLIITESEKENA